MESWIRGWSRTRAVRGVVLLQVVFLTVVALRFQNIQDYFLRDQLFLFAGLVGGIVGGVVLGRLPVGYDGSRQFGGVVYDSVKATVIGTFGFHVVRFGYLLVEHWSGYPILQKATHTEDLYVVVISRFSLVVFAGIGTIRYVLAAIVAAGVASAVSYVVGVEINSDRERRATDQEDGGR